MNLTDRQSASGASLTDLIHVVLTGDTSQSPAGSSYKVEIGEYKTLFTNEDVYVTGGTYSSGTATFRNNTGGTFNVTGFSTSGGTGTSYWSAGTGTNAIVTINSGNIASGNYAVAEGNLTQAIGTFSHAEGQSTKASGSESHAEGNNTQANGGSSHAEGNTSQAWGYCSHAEGNNSIANGQGSHAEGINSIAGGQGSHAEGINSQALGDFSHAEGNGTQALGIGSHAQGIGTIAGGDFSHAEGNGSKALGGLSHAEGYRTIASGDTSHAEGYYSRAFGLGSHAGGGSFTIGFSGGTAIGRGSFVHGDNAYSVGDYSIVLGRNLTGATADTTYVDHLSIKSVLAGPGTIDLGVDANGFVVNQASDERLKENINTITDALDTVNNLRGVTYNWKNRESGGDGLRYGFIAQEVQEVVPDLVTTNGEYLGVQYKDIPALLVEAIKELTAKITELESTIIELKNK